VDRCYGWKVTENGAVRASLDKQDENTKREFADRTERIIVQLKEQGLNSELYWDNTDLARTVSLVPTSAITGEGVCDLLLLLCKLTQTRMAQALMYVDVVQCTILEVKQLEGLGTTIDVTLVNGTLHEGDTIVVRTHTTAAGHAASPCGPPCLSLPPPPSLNTHPQPRTLTSSSPHHTHPSTGVYHGRAGGDDDPRAADATAVPGDARGPPVRAPPLHPGRHGHQDRRHGAREGRGGDRPHGRR
jgi:hypothetical protein